MDEFSISIQIFFAPHAGKLPVLLRYFEERFLGQPVLVSSFARIFGTFAKAPNTTTALILLASASCHLSFQIWYRVSGHTWNMWEDRRTHSGYQKWQERREYGLHIIIKYEVYGIGLLILHPRCFSSPDTSTTSTNIVLGLKVLRGGGNSVGLKFPVTLRII